MNTLQQELKGGMQESLLISHKITSLNHKVPISGIWGKRTTLLLSFLGILAIVLKTEEYILDTPVVTSSNRRILMQNGLHLSQLEHKEEQDKIHLNEKRISVSVLNEASKTQTDDGAEINLEDRVDTNKKTKYNDQGKIYSPVVHENQKVMVYKAKGQGTVVWYVVSYQKAIFLVAESGFNTPSRIVSPNGAILDIHSSKAREYDELKTIWGTVVLPDGTHYNFDDSLWQSAIKLPISSDRVSPAITIESGNIVSANRVAFGDGITNQILIVLDSPSTNQLLKKSVTSGTQIIGTISTSDHGFKIVEFRSYTSDHKTDKYRVCIFCVRAEMIKRGISRRHLLEEPIDVTVELEEESEQTNEVSQTEFTRVDLKDFAIRGLNSFKLKDLNHLDDPNNLKKLEFFFWIYQHELPRIVFVDDSHPVADYFLISVQDGTYISYEPEDLNNLVSLEKEGKLLKPWLTEARVSLLTSDTNFTPLIMYNDELYELNINIAKDYGLHVAETYEPEFAAVKSNEIQPGETDYNKFSIHNKQLKKWFTEVSTMPGFFIRSNISPKKRSWPFVLHKEDKVVRKYFLNIDLIKKVLTTSIKELKDSEEINVASFVQTHEHDFHFDILESSEEFEFLSWNHIEYKNQALFLNANCIEAFFELNETGLFEKADPSVHLNLKPRQKFVRVEGQQYIFDFNVLVSLVDKDGISNPQSNVTVRRCLDLPTYSRDPEAIRSLTISPAKSFEGKCDGEFLNQTICRGIFSGQYLHCRHIGAIRPCEETIDYFVCKGEMSPTGCEGSIEGKFLVNGTLYDLKTDQSFSVVDDETMGLTSLEYHSETSDIKIQCKKNYNILSQDCQNAELEKRERTSDGLATRMTLTCSGTLRLTKLDCADSLLKLSTCIDLAVNTDESKCTNSFYSRTCHKGGDFTNCYLFQKDDLKVDCFGGIWDGTNCYIKPKYVIVDEHRYFESDHCSGKYNEGSVCEGEFDGWFIDCPDVIDLIKLCGKEHAVDKIFCNGTLTNEGCVGDWVGSSIVNETLNFTLTAKGTTAPSGTNVFDHSKVTLILKENKDLIQKTSGFNWVNVSVVCKDGYNANSKVCSNAIFKGDSKNDVIWNYIQITCIGNLNLATLECSESPVVISNCITDVLTNPLPTCNGQFTQRKCMKGGGPFSCSSETIESKTIVCNDALWNGQVCEEKEFILIINDHVYVTGFCSGITVELESCEGTLIGDVVICPKSFLTPDITCKSPFVHHFSCQGFADSNGCRGRFNGMTEARGDYLVVDVEKVGLTSYFKQVTNGITTLGFSSRVNKPVHSIVTNQDSDLVGKCFKSFEGVEHECTKADLNITVENTPNNTYISVKCEQTLNLNSLNCSEGPYFFASCETGVNGPWADKKSCLGEYYYLECAQGGNSTNCTNSTSNDVQIYCDGRFHDGICHWFTPPQLPIIEVNKTYYIKGNCSSKIIDNSCNGLFKGTEVVTCEGDPLHNRTDFEACKLIEGEVFGECLGFTNGKGCNGYYSQIISVNGETWDLKSKEYVHYDFESVLGASKVTKRQSEETKAQNQELHCYRSLNPRTLTCEKGQYRQTNSNPPGGTPGIYQTTSVICENSTLNIYDRYTCSEDTYRYYSCLGKSQRTGGESHDMDENKTYTCLGDLKYRRCHNGGNSDDCYNADSTDLKGECLNSFYNGIECLKDKAAENSPIIINDLGRQTVTDIDGQEVIVHEFSVDGFTMYGAESVGATIADCVLDRIPFTEGIRNSDGSMENFDLPPTPTSMMIDEGILKGIKFYNFQLDELPYRRFCGDNEAKFIKVTFKSLMIKQFFMMNTNLHNVVIQKLTLGNQTFTDYGADDIDLSLAYGELMLRDVTIYLPYIPESMIDAWQSDRNNKNINANLAVPKVEAMEIPTYVLKFTHENALFIEFPTLELDNRSLDLLTIQDYIMKTSKFTSNPSAAEIVNKNYHNWISNHKAFGKD